MFKKIKNAEFKAPTGVSAEAADLLQRMMTPDPHKRITIEQIRQVSVQSAYSFVHVSAFACVHIGELLGACACGCVFRAVLLVCI